MDTKRDYGEHFNKAIREIRSLPPSEKSAISNRRTAPARSASPPSPSPSQSKDGPSKKS